MKQGQLLCVWGSLHAPRCDLSYICFFKQLLYPWWLKFFKKKKQNKTANLALCLQPPPKNDVFLTFNMFGRRQKNTNSKGRVNTGWDCRRGHSALCDITRKETKQMTFLSPQRWNGDTDHRPIELTKLGTFNAADAWISITWQRRVWWGGEGDSQSACADTFRPASHLQGTEGGGALLHSDKQNQ